jgi:PIN domain nuclease of toxin-antitoxin system
MSKVVLDASAVLAVLNQEKGSEDIAQLMDDAIISSVNLSEVVAKLAEVGVTKEDIEQILSNLNLNVAPFSQEQAWKAGMLRPLTKSIGLSLGDRACLALAISLNLPVITTDRLWGNLNLEVEIRVMR